MYRTLISAGAASAILFGAYAATAQTMKPTNPNNRAPGQMMQDTGSVKGEPGASGYTPGHQMQERGSVTGSTGASGYAPSHEPKKK